MNYSSLQARLLGILKAPGTHYNNLVSSNVDTRRNVIYVLGGTPDSLKMKFSVVAHLYRAGRVKKIMVLSNTGTTEYIPSMKRNLTYDEWSVLELEKLGVNREDIKFIDIREGFWGTLSEAKTVSHIAMEDRIQRLFLVCSSYHEKRVWLVFSAFLMNQNVKIEIHSADEKVGLSILVMEYIKLVLYKNILIPLETQCKDRQIVTMREGGNA